MQDLIPDMYTQSQRDGNLNYDALSITFPIFTASYQRQWLDLVPILLGSTAKPQSERVKATSDAAL